MSCLQSKGQHDDLVLSTPLACWYCENMAITFYEEYEFELEGMFEF
jgi:hypothetical protein